MTFAVISMNLILQFKYDERDQIEHQKFLNLRKFNFDFLYKSVNYETLISKWRVKKDYLKSH